MKIDRDEVAKRISESDDYGYSVLINAVGWDIMLEEHFGDYQGDIFFILHNGYKWGFLVQGYGSCSGCDEYEAIYDKDSSEMVDLAITMHNRVVTFPTAVELLHAILKKDWEGSHFYWERDWKKVFHRVNDLLGFFIYYEALEAAGL